MGLGGPLVNIRIVIVLRYFHTILVVAQGIIGKEEYPRSGRVVNQWGYIHWKANSRIGFCKNHVFIDDGTIPLSTTKDQENQ